MGDCFFSDKGKINIYSHISQLQQTQYEEFDEPKINKVVRDGMVAVLYSWGYGSGWSTEGLPPETIFHPKLVELVEEDRHHEITEELCEELFDHDCAYRGSDSLDICWVPQGTKFYIDNDDGNETVYFSECDDCYIA